MASIPSEDRLLLQSQLQEIARAEEVILDAAARHGFDESECFAIRLSLEEALTNAIKHGNRFDRDKTVVLAYCIDDEQLRVSITDEGGGFVPADVPDPTLDENLERPSGRGIMLMRAFMNRVEFSADGQTVTMIKQRSEH